MCNVNHPKEMTLEPAFEGKANHGLEDKTTGGSCRGQACAMARLPVWPRLSKGMTHTPSTEQARSRDFSPDLQFFFFVFFFCACLFLLCVFL